MENMKGLWTKYKEVVMYIVFGVATTVVNWGVYTALVKGAGMDVIVSNVCAWFLSVVFAYFTNKLWVFESKSWNINLLLKEVTSFFGARLVSGAFEMLAFPALLYLGLNQTILGIKGMAAKLVLGVIVIILNYVFSKLFIFKKQEVQQ